MSINCSVGNVPKNDDEYFEEMTKVIFKTGFNGQVIESKWPGFWKAFHQFSIQKVAGFDVPDIDRLQSDKDIVRNLKKINATLKNAQEMLIIQKEYKSFSHYLKEIGQKGELSIVKEISKRFHHLGKSNTLFFLRAVGLEMPESISLWLKEKKKII